ncbi:hypothetical protein Rhopal_003990-T1 [Rhodotorula paludigena]|uniref:Uncharacterized protein n=1 Tax=Rhodotorula paludigena TaxID=86838 RepID=A0AAV5GEI8_9BASI|nr:hypothetical protein Rhopal_003990-T1 [Rhodotorula paludigena]
MADSAGQGPPGAAPAALGPLRSLSSLSPGAAADTAALLADFIQDNLDLRSELEAGEIKVNLLDVWFARAVSQRNVLLPAALEALYHLASGHFAGWVLRCDQDGSCAWAEEGEWDAPFVEWMFGSLAGDGPSDNGLEVYFAELWPVGAKVRELELKPRLFDKYLNLLNQRDPHWLDSVQRRQMPPPGNPKRLPLPPRLAPVNVFISTRAAGGRANLECAPARIAERAPDAPRSAPLPDVEQRVGSRSRREACAELAGGETQDLFDDGALFDHPRALRVNRKTELVLGTDFVKELIEARDRLRNRWDRSSATPLLLNTWMQHATFERKVAVTEILKAVALLRNAYRRSTVTVLTPSGEIKTCIGNFDNSIVQIALDQLVVSSNLTACSSFASALYNVKLWALERTVRLGRYNSGIELRLRQWVWKHVFRKSDPVNAALFPFIVTHLGLALPNPLCGNILLAAVQSDGDAIPPPAQPRREPKDAKPLGLGPDLKTSRSARSAATGAALKDDYDNPLLFSRLTMRSTRAR